MKIVKSTQSCTIVGNYYPVRKVLDNRKGVLAIILGVQTSQVYLLGLSFSILTDHRSLKWLDRLKENNSRLSRWSLELQPYQYCVQYRTGKENGNADALSQYLVDATGESQEKGEGVSGKPVSATAETLIGVDESVGACKSLHRSV